jgi:hypothetical protein
MCLIFCPVIQGFVFQFCDHAQEELDKFGYQVSEESIIIQESCHILAICWNLLSKYGDFR